MRNILVLLIAALLASRPASSTDFLMMEIGWPLINHTAATSTFGTSILSGSTLKVAWTFQCEKAATINGLGFRYGARAGTPPTYLISLQGVNGSGSPDGTVKGGGSPVSHAFTPPADTSWDASTRRQALDNNYTCTRGEFLAIVVFIRDCLW